MVKQVHILNQLRVLLEGSLVLLVVNLAVSCLVHFVEDLSQLSFVNFDLVPCQHAVICHEFGHHLVKLLKVKTSGIILVKESE
jgi:hypothetical protein